MIFNKCKYKEEFGYVLKGKINLVLGKQIYKVKGGESFYFFILTYKNGKNINDTHAY